jgi:hypothetical protein
MTSRVTTEQIEDQLTTIYARRRELNRAAAALNLARAVARLREQFPKAAYAWVHVGRSAYVSGQYAADILRVHSATGSCLWHADDVDTEEIESPATDALVYAAEASRSSVPTYTERSHPVAGATPDTETGEDPALLVFADVDKAAQAAVHVTPAVPAGQPWSTVYRTAAGRRVYVVHNGPIGGTVCPITGDGGTVRVEYLTDDGRQVDHFGWEHPDNLTVR